MVTAQAFYNRTINSRKGNSPGAALKLSPGLFHQCCREVTLVVEGVDKYNNLFATVLLPVAEGAPRESLAEHLVKDGLAKV